MSGLKTSTIKKLFRNRIEAWLATIEDPEVKKIAGKEVIVSGGAIASALAGDKINDYDMYFATYEGALAITKYYVQKFNEAIALQNNPNGTSRSPVVKEGIRKNCKGVEEKRIFIYMKSSGIASEADASNYKYFEGQPEHAADDFLAGISPDSDDDALEEIVAPATEELASLFPDGTEMEKAEKLAIAVKAAVKNKPFRPVFLSENAITLSNKVQLVIRFSGEPETLHENYDFAHAMCSYRYDTDKLICPPEALECILSKTLIYKGSLYPLASIFRLRKFYERGWRITAGQLLKVMFQISNLDLKDRNTLREQLIGVDQAYMYQLLRELENNEGKVDTTYLAKLVDEIFE